MSRGWWLALGAVVILCLAIFVGLREEESSVSSEAYSYYLQGEKTKTLAEREEAFNKALKLYKSLEGKDDGTTHGKGLLYYNIANSYFQLKEYPQAILYYHKAKKILPRNEQVAKNLAIAEETLQLKDQNQEAWLDNPLLFDNYFSMAEQWQLLFWILLTLFLSLSIYIWWGDRRFFGLSLCLGVLFILLLLSLTYSHYLSPVAAVIVKPSLIYRNDSAQAPVVTAIPLRGGTTVEVISADSEGSWLRITTPDGATGYVPHATLRTI